jgi:hypothetical protein
MSNIKQEADSLCFIKNEDIAINERESNGVLYTLGKPSNSHINELREQKKRLMTDKLTDKPIDTIITPELKDLGTTRNEERKIIENRITDKILTFFKNSQGFSKSDLNALFVGTQEKTKQRLTKKIIKNLELQSKIKKTIIKAKYISLVNRNIGSNDYGSFALVMKRGCVLSSRLSVGKKVDTYSKAFYEFI